MLQEIRKKVLEQARLAEKLDLCQSGGGNFSMIDREKGLVAITPHDTDRTSMSWRDVVVIDMEGNQVAGTSELRASLEHKIHLAVYEARSDVNAIAHTHAAYALVFAALGMEIKPVVTEATAYNNKCPLAPYANGSSPELGRNIVNALGEKGLAALMESHGLITVTSGDIADAVRINQYVEITAKCYYRMIQLVGFEKVLESCITEDKLVNAINYLSVQGYREALK